MTWIVGAALAGLGFFLGVTVAAGIMVVVARMTRDAFVDGPVFPEVEPPAPPEFLYRGGPGSGG